MPVLFYSSYMVDSEKIISDDRLQRECCPLCAGKNLVFERKVRDHIDHSCFSVSKCNDCSLRFISDPPSPETINKYYSNDAAVSMHKHGSNTHQKLRKMLLMDELKPLTKRLQKNSEIIDYGAGDGSVSEALKSMGFKVSAMDMYPQSEWLHPDIEYQQKDINMPLPPYGLPGPDEPVRAVVMRHVIEHLYDPVKVLSSMRYADIKYVLIITPNYNSIMRPLLGESWYYWDPPRHLAYFNKKSIYCLAERCGYKLVETATYAVDEIVTSFHRRMLINSSTGQSELTRRIIRSTDPKSPLAAISSAVASFFGNCVIHAILEKYKQH